MANRKQAKQARKNNGIGFINPPYQNGVYKLPSNNIDRTVLPVFHKMARRCN